MSNSMISAEIGNRSVSTSTIEPSTSLECDISAIATVRLTVEEVNGLRKMSDRLPGNLGNSTLRHTDEQTLASLVAVKQATADLELMDNHFWNWGVAFSSRYLGRSTFSHSLTKYSIEGAWNVSVQIVPNRSLHSPASMIGLALGCHGPCVGVGGGLDGEPDALITGMSLLEQHSLSGMWLVFSGWRPDELIDEECRLLVESQCTAVALAIQPKSQNSQKGSLKIVCDPVAPSVLPIPCAATVFDQFVDLESSDSLSHVLNIDLGGCLRAEIDWKAAARSTIRIDSVTPSKQRKAA
jgi:hypothetical protein